MIFGDLMKKNICWFLSLFFIPIPFTFAAFSPPVIANKAMVVTAQPLASQIAINILKQGGNAIDAAVAVGYALAVVQPCCGNIGGGGFMLVHLADGKNIFIDFREKAPAAINVNDFFDATGHEKKTALFGYLPVGVSGTVMGLNTALQKYGHLPLKTVMAPAIQLAQRGFTLRDGDVCLLNMATHYFAQQPNVRNLLLSHGKPYQVGDLFIQKNLARSLRLISEKGTQAFYKGPIAQAIVTASQANHGVLTLADFANYNIAINSPISCEYRGYQVLTAPPPGSGATVCEILNIVSGFPLHDLGFNSAQAVHDNVEAMRYAFADRNQYLGDPDFVTNPIEKLLSPNYADTLRAQIKPATAGNSMQLVQTAQEKPETSEYAIIDQAGNAVSVTYTLNGYFGSGVIAGNTGFFLNNELNDFTLKTGVANQFKLVQGIPNLIAPNKRPLSSMSPTILLKDNKPFLITGAAGGSTIITMVTEIIENVVDWQMDINAAVNSPRYHMQWLPDMIYYEPDAFSQDTLNVLKKMRYPMQLGSPFHTNTWGQAVGIMIDPATRIFAGAADYRHLDGSTMGIRAAHAPERTCPSSQS
jgi:gamma-glutamyltranspeptidase/glutathione hydrolase